MRRNEDSNSRSNSNSNYRDNPDYAENWTPSPKEEPFVGQILTEELLKKEGVAKVLNEGTFEGTITLKKSGVQLYIGVRKAAHFIGMPIEWNPRGLNNGSLKISKYREVDSSVDELLAM